MVVVLHAQQDHSVDNRLKDFPNLSQAHLKPMGLQYFAKEELEYLTDEVLGVTEEEVSLYQQACKELYRLYEEATQYVIEKSQYHQLGIPKQAIPLIEHSWHNRQRHLHLYSRFDLGGVLNNQPAKLIEFNADTATVIPETAIIQKEQIKLAGISPTRQFNNFIPDLTQRFQQLKRLHPNKEPKMLFSTLGFEEDILNAQIIANAAQQAGFDIQHLALKEVVFSAEDGIFMELGPENYIAYDFWFKLIPWEFIAYEEPKLMKLLTDIVLNDLAVIINPAYTMLYQSKAMMKILWMLNPNHPLLLKTSDSSYDFHGEYHVKKVIFGREGENIEVFNTNGRALAQNEGDFGRYPSIYQAFEPLPTDDSNEIYQAGLYYTDQTSALSYRRRDGLIVDEDSEFIGHYLM